MEKDIVKPEGWLKYIDKIPRNSKYACVSALIVGIIAHLYMFTNKLPNYDDLTGVAAYGAGSGLGRWFLEFLGELKHYIMGNYSMPWFNGLFFLGCIGIVSGIVVSVLDVQDRLLCILIGAIMSCFPVTTGTLFFMFTVPFYGISLIFVTVSAVLFAQKKVLLNFVGVVLCVLSMGIYQAYLPFCTTLLVFMLLKQILEEEKFVNIVSATVRYIACLIGAVVLYIVVTKLFWSDYLSDYQGVNQMGEISLKKIPQIIGRIYSSCTQMICSNYLGLNPYISTQKGLLILSMISGGGIFVLVYELFRIRSADSALRGIAFVILTIICPASVFGIYIMCSSGTFIYPIMLYSVVFLFILPLFLLDNVNTKFGVIGSKTKCWKEKLMTVTNMLVTFLTVIIIASYCHCDNEYYLRMDGSFKQAQSVLTTLITQIREVDGYEDGMPVAFIGRYQDADYYDFEKNFDGDSMAGRSNYIVDSYQQVMRQYCGFYPEILHDTTELEKRDEIVKMPCYPDNGSICIIDNIVIVKLSG